MANDLVGRLFAIYTGRLADGTCAPPIARGDPEGEIPLGFFQERIWRALHADPRTTAYNTAFSFRLPEAIDADLLARCLGEIARRHDALRMVFSRARPEARVVEAGPFPLERVDLRAFAEPFEEARRRAAAEMMRPFPLERSPPLRATLYELAAGDHLLALAYHEIILSRPAVAMLLGELERLYPALAAGRPAPLPEPPIQLSDYMRWQRGWLQGEELERRLGRWRERLARHPLVTFPIGGPEAPPRAGERFGHQGLAIPAPLEAALHALCAGEEATPFMVLAAALFALLSGATSAKRITLPSMAVFRRRETHGVIGTFSNLIHLCVDLSDDPSFRTLVARVREATLEAIADQLLPTWTALPGEAATTDGLLLDHFATVKLPLALAGASAQKETLSFTPGKDLHHEMEWRAYPAGEGTALVVPFDRARFRAETVADLLGRFVRLLGESVASPARALSALYGATARAV